MTKDTHVMLGHGSGGIMMKRIIDEVFFDAYGNDTLGIGDDAAVLPPLCSTPSAPSVPDALDTQNTPGATNTPSTQGAPDAPSAPVTPDCSRLAFSTDSFVVTPHFFPGGDIGRLAICGTVNDVATSGATPLYLSISVILEEGFPIVDLKQICKSMADAAKEAGVKIVTGDTKVVNRGHGDGIYINTSGVGALADGLNLGGAQCRPGDAVLVTGTLGDHGITIMSQRENLSFSADIKSDAAPLNHLIAEVCAAAPGSVRCFRDPTRGGLASTLNELAAQAQADIIINEEAIPIKPAVLGACEMLGYDALQVANEGKMVCVVAPDAAPAALAAMQANKYGKDAAIIGKIDAAISPDNTDRGPRVFLRTAFGSTRILDMLVGEQLPRIC